MTCPDDGHTLLNSSDPVQLLTLSHAHSPDQDTIRKLGNYLLVWNIADQVLMVDLNHEQPTPVAELSDTDKFTEVNNFVTTGFKPSFKDKKTQ